MRGRSRVTKGSNGFLLGLLVACAAVPGIGAQTITGGEFVAAADHVSHPVQIAEGYGVVAGGVSGLATDLAGNALQSGPVPAVVPPATGTPGPVGGFGGGGGGCAAANGAGGAPLAAMVLVMAGVLARRHRA